MKPFGRRFPDGRSAVARRWAAVHAAVEATYPPSTGLDRILTGMAVDVICDYQDLRAEPDPDRKRASSRRKTLGLALSVLGKLERLRQGTNGDQARSAEALQAILAKVTAARQGGS